MPNNSKGFDGNIYNGGGGSDNIDDFEAKLNNLKKM